MSNVVIAPNGVEVQKFRVLGSYRAGVDIVHKVQAWEDGEAVISWMGNDEWRELVWLG